MKHTSMADGARQPCAGRSGICKHAGATGCEPGQASGPLTNRPNRAHFNPSNTFLNASESACAVLASWLNTRRRNVRSASRAGSFDVLSMTALSDARHW